MYDPRWDNPRERDDGRPRVYAERERDDHDPRDSLMHDLDLPRRAARSASWSLTRPIATSQRSSANREWRR
jgi:hypothetical protein